MSSQEKSAPEKFITTPRDGKPFIKYNPEYNAYLRHQTRWPDRILSGLVGIAGAAIIGTAVAAAGYVIPLVPVAAQGAMTTLSAIAATTGVVAAAGVAAVAGVAGLAVIGVAGVLALQSAFRLYDEYTIAMEHNFRPLSALSAGGAMLAAAVSIAVTAAPAHEETALSKTASASAAFGNVSSRTEVTTATSVPTRETMVVKSKAAPAGRI